MKTCFLLLSLSFMAFGQNPDGKNVSIHVTPSWLWGNTDFERVTKIWYPPTQVSDEFHVTSSNYGITEYPFAFGFHTQIKVPTTSFLTLSLSYSFNQKFKEDKKGNVLNNYFSEVHSINGNYHAVSVTMSLYNVFSLYIE